MNNDKNKSINSNVWNKNELPNEVKSKIFSYLYFSDKISNKIRIVNESIKEYNIVKLRNLCGCHGFLNVNYFVLKYFLYDKINSEILYLDYNILSKDTVFQKSELERIFRTLRPVDVLRFCKYIESSGPDSVYYCVW